jgi:hypothetical protein
MTTPTDLDRARAREIATELHEYGFGGDQLPETVEAMNTLASRIAAALRARASAC